jgi:hypothetical protein
MAFNINEMRSQLALGGARPSLFQITITNVVNPAADLKVPFLCRAAMIPSSTIGVIPVPYMGRVINEASSRPQFAPWQVQVINDEDFLIRNALENWHNAINSLEGNLRTTGTPASTGYKSQASVTQYGKTGDVLRVYQFNGLFPSDITSINLDWQTADLIEEFNVTFQYDNWEIIGGKTGNAGGV